MAQDLRPASSARANNLPAGDGFIEHHVSKLDTLAGVAIKYGVEVADVKRLNGLVSDFQMFAHKTLRIPVDRRHPAPSTLIRSENSSLSGCPLSSEQAPSLNTQLKTLNSHEKRVREKSSLSLAMNLLRGYYGLPPPPARHSNGNNAGMETLSFKVEAEEHPDDESFFCIAEKPIRGLKNGYKSSNGVHASKLSGREVEGLLRSTDVGQVLPAEVLQTSIGGADSSSVNERSVRRRFKTDAAIPSVSGDNNDECKRDTCAFDKPPPAPTSGLLGATLESSGGLPVVIRKALDGALVSGGSGNGKGKDSLVKVKKSPSASNLQDSTSSKAAELKSGGSAFGSRMSSDAPPKPVSIRFKAALD